MTTEITTKKEKYLIGLRTFAGKIRTVEEKEKLSRGFSYRLGHGKKV